MGINFSLLRLQGEKAYSCEQCGTRFTYRNGLIKHKKLNRCPKKIITPEGETIIKKRSRTFANANGGKKEASKPTTDLVAPPPPPPPPPPSSLPPQPHQSALEPTPTPAPSVNGTLLVQNNQIQLQTQVGTYGLALLEDGSLIATPQQPVHAQAQPVSQQTSKLLHPNVIAALSAATGLSAHEISSWAAHLPAGSTVKVTHHFDHPQTPTNTSPAGQQAAAKLATSYDHVLPSLPKTSAGLVANSVPHRQLLNPSGGNSNLATEMASACCHDSLISSCVGLPSYQESFAVDPNEVLSKDRLIKRQAMTSPSLPVEPSLANSRLLSLPSADLSSSSSSSSMSYSDFDIDLDDIDIDAVHSLNDQEFTSIRSIVEQTFKDGRDVLDIISAV